MVSKKQAERAEAIATLRKWLKPGSTVYTVLRHVSRSGMSRDISLVIIHKGETLHPNHIVSRAIGERLVTRNGSDALRVGGCGMDMGFHIVYALGYALWPKGFKLPKGAYGRNGDTSGYETDGGYALKHRWL